MLLLSTGEAAGSWSRDAAERAVAWAAEAGRTVYAERLADLLALEPDPAAPVAENLLFQLLARLGVVPL